MKKVLLAVISLFLLSCQSGVVFTEFQALPPHGWEADSVKVFSPNLADTMGDYQMQIILRHNDRYAYQNVWFFVDVTCDSILLRRDTIEAMMANDHGEWYGQGCSKYTLPIIYLEHVSLPSGHYQVLVQQAMREDTLRGINDIGLKVIKNNP